MILCLFLQVLLIINLINNLGLKLVNSINRGLNFLIRRRLQIETFEGVFPGAALEPTSLLHSGRSYHTAY